MTYNKFERRYEKFFNKQNIFNLNLQHGLLKIANVGSAMRVPSDRPVNSYRLGKEPGAQERS
jgi:hypothetical protein